MSRVVHHAFASVARSTAGWSALAIGCALGIGCIALKDSDPVPNHDGGSAASTLDEAAATAPEVGDLESAEVGANISSPMSVAPDHLRLWLKADQGITCVAGRLTRWEDQSGRANHASPQYGQLGPHCDLASHAYLGVMLPYFSAPKTQNIYDETLDIDLNCLVNVEYTLFVVERRWADYQDRSSSAEYVVGTTVQGAALAHFDGGCAPGAFQFGYAYDGDGPQLVLDQGCSRAASSVKRVPSSGPAALSEETGSYSGAWGHALWIPGAPIAHVSDQTELTSAYGGAIGRGIVSNSKSDTRFRGDIAEIVIYDTALDTVEMSKIERYLALHWHYMW
jgi:hypothetical protein